MTLTIMGYVFIPLGLYLLFSKPECLLYMCVLLSGFSGSAIVNVGENGFSVHPSYYFAILWLIWLCFKKKYFFRICRPKKKYILLYVFVAFCLFSFIMPFVLPSTVKILNVDGAYDTVGFKISNITQFLYLLLCVLVYIGLLIAIDTEAERIKKFYLMGVMLTCLVTFYQIIAFHFGLPFDRYFRQCVHGNIQGDRIYGPCIEASMLAYYLVSALPICIRASNKKMAFGVTIMCVFLGVYSYSSSFIVGLGVWIILELTVSLYKKKIKMRRKDICVFGGLILLCVFAAIYKYEYIDYAINKLILTISKANQSGTSRSEHMEILFDAFKKSPFWGTGFGSCRGTDLLTTWLASVGIVGMGVMVVFLIKTIFLSQGKVMYKEACIIVWIIMMISVPEPYNLFVWVLLAMVDGPNNKKIKIEGTSNDE